ncbi:hypothetical protein BGY98DRAFT_1004840 [Russula aff. rugulosa BPL654]|nr:hypothetical protein BGY98DRAFT_1004840 [Russula aff. rugulosa BPL654]
MSVLFDFGWACISCMREPTPTASTTVSLFLGGFIAIRSMSSPHPGCTSLRAVFPTSRVFARNTMQSFDALLSAASAVVDPPTPSNSSCRSLGPRLSTPGSCSVGAHVPPSVHGPSQTLLTLGRVLVQSARRRCQTAIRSPTRTPTALLALSALSAMGSTVPLTDPDWLVTAVSSVLASSRRSSTHGRAQAVLSLTTRVRQTIQPVCPTSRRAHTSASPSPPTCSAVPSTVANWSVTTLGLVLAPSRRS